MTSPHYLDALLETAFGSKENWTRVLADESGREHYRRILSNALNNLLDLPDEAYQGIDYRALRRFLERVGSKYSEERRREITERHHRLPGNFSKDHFDAPKSSRDVDGNRRRRR